MPNRIFILIVLIAFLPIKGWNQKFIGGFGGNLNLFTAVLFLDSVHCNARASIFISPTIKNKKFTYELLNTDPNRAFTRLTTDTFIKNVPKGYYNLNLYDGGALVDSFRNFHIGFEGAPISRHFCTGSTENSFNYFYLINALLPIKLVVKNNKNDSVLLVKTDILDSVIISKDSFIWNQVSYHFIDACGDSIRLSKFSDGNNNRDIESKENCDNTVTISYPILASVLDRPLPSLKYTWQIDSTTYPNVTELKIKSSNRPINIKLTLSDSSCAIHILKSILPEELRHPQVKLTVEKFYSCNPDSNFLEAKDIHGNIIKLKWNTSDSVTRIKVKNDGIYSVMAQSNDGCTDTAHIDVRLSRLRLSSQKSDNLCFGNNTASIDLQTTGGLNPIRYQWSDNVFTEDRNNLINGTFKVLVIDSLGCKADTSFNITSPPPLGLNLTARAATCIPAKDGMVTVMPVGGLPPYDITWSNGLKLFNVDTLSVGNYKIVVTDKNGCITSYDFRIDDLSPLRNAKVDTLCFGGTLTVGTKKYAASGIYTDTLKSFKGCDSIHTTLLTINPTVDFSMTTTEPTCNGSSDGSIKLNIFSGFSAFTYSLNNRPAVLADFSKISSGNYIVKVQDRYGCIKEKGVAVSNPDRISLSIGKDTLIEYGDTLYAKAITNLDTSKVKSIRWKTDPLEANCNTCNKEFNYRPKEDHKITVTLESKTGCIVEATRHIKINFNFKSFVPNVFYPANASNTVNSSLTVMAGRQVQKVNYFKIFNRFGNQVFERSDFLPNDLGAGWDGTYRGSDALTGVYVYLAEVLYVDGRIQKIKGDITLIR